MQVENEYTIDYGMISPDTNVSWINTLLLIVLTYLHESYNNPLIFTSQCNHLL